MKIKLFILLMTIIVPTMATAQMAPALVNYQGTLQDSSGNPASSGNYEIEFRLWNAATAGSAIWGETVQAYVATGGLFNVLLGSGAALGGIQTSNLLQALKDEERYLGMTITVALGTPVDPSTEISPRQQMASAPYAIQAANGVPPGSITAYAGTLTPSGWILCDGSEVSRTTYADLFAAIGTAYGMGDGSTTFNVPDLAGKVPVGLDSGDATFDTRGYTGGEKEHTLTTGEMPVHNHTATDSGHSHPFSEEGVQKGEDTSRNWEDINTYAEQQHSRTTSTGYANITVGNAGGGGEHNNLQPYLVVNYIIKY